MTSPQPAVTRQEPAPPPPEITVTPQPGDGIDDLRARLADADARLADAKRNRDSADAALKQALTALVPRDGTGQLTAAVVNVPATSHLPALRLGWGAKRLFDKERFEAEHPGVYDRYLKWGQGFWGWRKA